jgi:conjugal transfer/entry exclusion protein
MAMLAGMLTAGSASSMIVFDPINFSANMKQAALEAVHLGVDTENAVVNTISMAMLKKIRGLAQSIDKHTAAIEGYTADIDRQTLQIMNVTNANYAINKQFTWITNNYYGDDFTCPPDASEDECSGIINSGADEAYAKLIDRASLDKYVENYQDAKHYSDSVADRANLTDVGLQASANQKIANDALARTLGTQRGSLKQQSVGISKLITEGSHAQGHGNQMQLANALAGAQAVQLQEMRSLMLASENARAARAQAQADREARELAASKSLRRNLRNAAGATRVKADAPAY